MVDSPGFSLSRDDPFADPPRTRDAARRLRARLTAPVTIWTADGDRGPVGLTVSSVLVAAGEPAHVLGLLSPDADLTDALVAGAGLVVHVLGLQHRALADVFAGLRPAPGGMFAGRPMRQTAHGPALTEVDNRASCRVVSSRTVGWSTLVEAVVEDVSVAELPDPLLYSRGRYRTVEGG